MTTKPIQALMSSNPYISALEWGGWCWGDPAKPAGSGAVISYYLNNDLYGPWGGAMRTWSASETSAFTAALQSWSNVANITFVSAAGRSSAQLIENLTDHHLMPAGILGEHGTPQSAHDWDYDQMRVVGLRDQAYGYYAYEAWSGNGLNPGGYDFVTFVHELGHGLGLAHPHDNGGGSTTLPGVTPGDMSDTGTYDLNQGIFTVMSYNDGWSTVQDPYGHGFTAYGYEAGPMAFDIAAIQHLYGANTTYHSGSDTYLLPDANQVGTAWRCIWDTGGVDTLRYNGAKSAILDLTAATLDNSAKAGGVPSYAKGIYGGFTIANGVVIENATGGSGADTITGNSAANVLTGNNGNDTITGGSGIDRLTGGAGIDDLDGGLGNDILTGGTEADHFCFTTALSPTNRDVIQDFTAGTDKLYLDNAVFSVFGTTGAITAANFVSGTAAADGNDYLIYNAANGQVSYDADGAGTGAAVLVATLSTHPALTASAFWIV